jgi:acyl dehydratase
MLLDASFIGRTYGPTEPYAVGRERILEFADAIGADDPAFRSPHAAAELGHPDVIAPPTFPILISNQAGQSIIRDPALGLDYSRVVHGDQRFAYVRPVRAGDRLICTIVVEEVMTRGGFGFLTTRTDIATDDGEPVVSVWTRLVAREAGSMAAAP